MAERFDPIKTNDSDTLDSEKSSDNHNNSQVTISKQNNDSQINDDYPDDDPDRERERIRRITNSRYSATANYIALTDDDLRDSVPRYEEPISNLTLNNNTIRFQGNRVSKPDSISS
ncbi:uncharacterized protein ASCRUDRAFT_68910 [Ascoidea rubescens DSM 1968]|uniref:Uncharacterized protein n=1 Tax=Ascoidea rubescens DSM 1968 TaxID=1344418 RepID=A0A1D2VNF9_9ASCO|nr:hypothetical protein ASCRUDRAFT_68910 [Ascoidea rubescens DSM 1968]ODV63140.1 hypothetical protein ASCRUDRAFT_68910 [Ascoidea rubescens DSM 1968]